MPDNFRNDLLDLSKEVNKMFYEYHSLGAKFPVRLFNAFVNKTCACITTNRCFHVICMKIQTKFALAVKFQEKQNSLRL